MELRLFGLWEEAEVEAQLLEEYEGEDRLRREPNARRHDPLPEAERPHLHDVHSNRQQSLHTTTRIENEDRMELNRS